MRTTTIPTRGGYSCSEYGTLACNDKGIINACSQTNASHGRIHETPVGWIDEIPAPHFSFRRSAYHIRVCMEHDQVLRRIRCQQGYSLFWAQGTLLTRPNRELDLYLTKWDFHQEHSLWVRPPSQQARAAVEEEDFHHHLQ